MRHCGLPSVGRLVRSTSDPCDSAVRPLGTVGMYGGGLRSWRQAPLLLLSQSPGIRERSCAGGGLLLALRRPTNLGPHGASEWRRSGPESARGGYYTSVSGEDQGGGVSGFTQGGAESISAPWARTMARSETGLLGPSQRVCERPALPAGDDRPSSWRWAATGTGEAGHRA